MMGTADIDRSENMCTTSNTGVVSVAVAMGAYGTWPSEASPEGNACTYVPILSLRRV